MNSSPASRVFLAVGVIALAAALIIVNAGWIEERIPERFRVRTLVVQSSSSVSSEEVSSSAQSRDTSDRLVYEEQIVAAVMEAEPAVVSVIISAELPKIERYYEEVPLGDEFFPGLDEDVFGGFRFRVPRYRQEGTVRREIGGGTAFFVTRDGLLMTNRHVVDDDRAEYTVLLNDGRKLPAKVAAIDQTNDIALLKVQGSGFTPLAVSPDDDVRLGQTAIAIGNSLGEFRNTVSVGVVSGLQRSIVAGRMGGGNAEELSEILQTDAAINEGNSGGPLLNAHGEVIGMNTAIAGGAQSIGFALPAKEIRRVLASYLEHGRIVRPYLGVRYMPITPELAKQNRLPVEYGALVVRGDDPTQLAILPGSPADKADIEENDVILEVDGEKLTVGISLARIVQRKQPGDTLRLKVLHDGKEREVEVKLEEWKEKQ